MKSHRFVLIGCGGIGGQLAPNLCRLLHGTRQPAHIVVVDGDEYELRNKGRMRFRELQNKAAEMARDLADEFGDLLTIEPVSEFVAQANIATILQENDVVFVAVDNHATRKLVDDHCDRLADIAVISGGNDGVEGDQQGTYGNVQISHRKEGIALTGSLQRFHPEIREPGDRSPDAMSCEELAQSGAPQLLVTNVAVASAMLSAFWALSNDTIDYEEVYVEISRNRVVPVSRTPPPPEPDARATPAGAARS